MRVISNIMCFHFKLSLKAQPTYYPCIFMIEAKKQPTNSIGYKVSIPIPIQSKTSLIQRRAYYHHPILPLIIALSNKSRYQINIKLEIQSYRVIHDYSPKARTKTNNKSYPPRSEVWYLQRPKRACSSRSSWRLRP